MTRHTNILTLSTSPDAPAHLSGWLESLRACIVGWATTWADAYAAAALYEQLSRLSDAELERRGIPRGDLHRRAFETLTRPANSGGSIADRTRV